MKAKLFIAVLALGLTVGGVATACNSDDTDHHERKTASHQDCPNPELQAKVKPAHGCVNDSPPSLPSPAPPTPAEQPKPADEPEAPADEVPTPPAAATPVQTPVTAAAASSPAPLLVVTTPVADSPAPAFAGK